MTTVYLTLTLTITFHLQQPLISYPNSNRAPQELAKVVRGELAQPKTPFQPPNHDEAETKAPHLTTLAPAIA